MRSIILLSILILGIGCTGTKDVATKAGNLTGTWVPVKQEMNGKELPKATFENEKLFISDSTYTLIAEFADKGVVRYNGNKMDIYGKQGPNKGKHFTAIYKYEKRQFTVCYNLAGDSYPETFETTGKPLFFLSVFKKE